MKVLKLVCMAAVLTAAGAVNDVDGVDDKKLAVTETTGVSSGRVVDGVLSLLGIRPPASAEDEDDDVFSGDGEDGDAKTKTGDPGERGIHKKKFYHHHLWHAFYWWAWVFAVIVVKFKIALLLIGGHVSYFIMALVRMLLREVPLWVQLKRENVPAYGPPPAQYGPPQYGPQYGSQYGAQYASSSYSPYKRRAGTAGAAATGAVEAAAGGGSGHDLAYGAHTQK